MDKLKKVHTLANIKSVLKDIEMFRGVTYLDQEFKDIDGLIQTLENNNMTHLSTSLKEELENNIVQMIEGKVLTLREKIQTHLDKIKATISGTKSTVKSDVSATFANSSSGESGSRSTGESGYRTSIISTPSRSSESSGRGGYSG